MTRIAVKPIRSQIQTINPISKRKPTLKYTGTKSIDTLKNSMVVHSVSSDERMVILSSIAR